MTVRPRPPVMLAVQREIDVVRAVHEARQLALALGFTNAQAYKIAISVSELANNLVFHTTHGGRISLRVQRRSGEVALEILCEDDGPGIENIELAMQDGFSTRGTLGSGLPAVRRLMGEFAITSEVGRGTRVVARKWRACE